MNDGETLTLKWVAGRYRRPVTITKDGNKLWLSFGFNKAIINEIKNSFTGAKWHGFENPPIKKWSVKDCEHNWFQIEFLSGNNPYDIYDKPLSDFEPKRNVYKHQCEFAKHILTRHYCIGAAEMGTGKTLAVIEAAEQIQPEGFLWVAPRSALHSVELEFKKWKSTVRPEFLTYHALKRYLENWPPGRKAPQLVVYDESSRLKNPTAQRTEAAAHLASSVRQDWGWDGYVVEMSGSPAPKSPLDWYSQCEIAMPGFLKEGDYNKFKRRLSIIKATENTITGGVFPQLITWLDDSSKCSECGNFEHDHEGEDHIYTPSTNEVANLYDRMKGLVLVIFKKDCLDLPEKQYKTINCKPSRETLQVAKMISNRATSAASALTLLRELSDGFQYTETECGEETCHLCKGDKTIVTKVYIGPEDYPDEVIPEHYESQIIACTNCQGVGIVTKYRRDTQMVPCPKEDVIKGLLDEHDDIGRLVIYGGFTGSVDRCVDIVSKANWDFIRVDGRGWHSSLDKSPSDLLETFQSDHPRIAFIGQPGAAGMGITLTASPTVVYYSNDFNAESRIQSEDRIHRPGMNVNRGATVIDILHLPTDEYVLENLKKKKGLQSMSLGDIHELYKVERS